MCQCALASKWSTRALRVTRSREHRTRAAGCTQTHAQDSLIGFVRVRGAVRGNPFMEAAWNMRRIALTHTARRFAVARHTIRTSARTKSIALAVCVCAIHPKLLRLARLLALVARAPLPMTRIWRLQSTRARARLCLMIISNYHQLYRHKHKRVSKRQQQRQYSSSVSRSR